MTRRPARSVAVAVLMLVVIAGGWFAISQDARAPAVDFRLADGSLRTPEDLAGRITVVSFWSPTCAPCVKEIPDFAALYEALRPQGLRMLAVSMPYDPPGQVIEFARRRGIPYPIALDIEGKAAQAFGVNAVPRVFVIDRQRRIVLDHQGLIDMLQLRSLLADLLAA